MANLQPSEVLFVAWFDEWDDTAWTGPHLIGVYKTMSDAKLAAEQHNDGTYELGFYRAVTKVNDTFSGMYKIAPKLSANAT